MTVVNAPAFKAWPARGRMTPDAVRRAAFSRAALGRRGYSEADVERFRARVADEMAAYDAEKAELREEVDRLRNYFRDLSIEPGRPHPGATAPSVQAVNALSAAQQAADQHIAQAQEYARRLLGNARSAYERILLEAQQKAEKAADEAARSYQEAAADHPCPGDHQHLESRIEYLRTYAEVSQVQMRSILDALGAELERLAQAMPQLPAATADPRP